MSVEEHTAFACCHHRRWTQACWPRDLSSTSRVPGCCRIVLEHALALSPPLFAAEHELFHIRLSTSVAQEEFVWAYTGVQTLVLRLKKYNRPNIS
jgi:hypothetical protein